jgi:putative ABC transport system ATP-binding protein
MDAVISLCDVEKIYWTGGAPFHALRSVSLEVGSGQLVVVTGRSGSGKSTLLNLITGIDRASGGRVNVAGVELGEQTEDELARFRGQHVGVVFQFFQLLPALTALENVLLPMDFSSRIAPSEQVDRARSLLARLGVLDQADKVPAELSGGQQQRVAIARALANDPDLLVADEPTGNLDSSTAADVLRLLAELVDDDTTVVIVTHEPDFASAFERRPDQVLVLEDGQLATDTPAREAL